MKPAHRPPHPYLPLLEDRAEVITSLARSLADPAKQRVTSVRSAGTEYRVSYLPRLRDVVITYTPLTRTNQQSSDIMRRPCVAVSSL